MPLIILAPYRRPALNINNPERLTLQARSNMFTTKIDLNANLVATLSRADGTNREIASFSTGTISHNAFDEKTKQTMGLCVLIVSKKKSISRSRCT
jgi:hypothetical protein